MSLSVDIVAESDEDVDMVAESNKDAEETGNLNVTPTCSKFEVNEDPDYIPSEDPKTDALCPKKRRVASSTDNYKKDHIPNKYRHLRYSERKVKNEVYETIDELKSVYHMSENQTEASIVCVGNKLFNRKWKFHDQSELIDLDTLPHKRNIRETGKCIQMVALEGIVQEIMSTDTQRYNLS